MGSAKSHENFGKTSKSLLFSPSMRMRQWEQREQTDRGEGGECRGFNTLFNALSDSFGLVLFVSVLKESLGKEANFKAMKKKLIAILIRFQILFSLLFIPLLFRESEDVCRWISSDFQLESAALSTSSTSSASQTRQRCCFFSFASFQSIMLEVLDTCYLYYIHSRAKCSNAPEDDEKLKEEGNQSKKESDVIERERIPETQYQEWRARHRENVFFGREREMKSKREKKYCLMTLE